MSEQYLTAREVGAILRCNERTVRRMVQRGDIPGQVIAGKVLVREADMPAIKPPRRPAPPVRKMATDGVARQAVRSLDDRLAS